MKVLSYKEWIALNPECKKTCESCGGSGKDWRIIRQGGKTVKYYISCYDCDGDGHSGRELYLEQLEKDRKLVQFAQEHGLIET